MSPSASPGAPPRSVVLHQFAYSHFNEKARWALDWKGVPHVRRTHLPGPHAPAMLRLSGQTATPVLVIDGQAVAGSARILSVLEERFPERPLLPEDPALRQRILAFEERFDREVGPAARTVLFSELIREPGYVCRVFAGHRSLPVRALYRAAFPVTGPIMARSNGVADAGSIERAFAVVDRTLEEVARAVGGGGGLFGSAFTQGDLVCAALLGVLHDPEHPDMKRPEPMPERVASLLARYAPHPAMQWVAEQYRKHRPPSAAVAPA